MKELWPLEENKYIFLFYGEINLFIVHIPVDFIYLYTSLWNMYQS